MSLHTKNGRVRIDRSIFLASPYTHGLLTVSIGHKRENGYAGEE
jgi:hypothetical protein